MLQLLICNLETDFSSTILFFSSGARIFFASNPFETAFMTYNNILFFFNLKCIFFGSLYDTCIQMPVTQHNRMYSYILILSTYCSWESSVSIEQANSFFLAIWVCLAIIPFVKLSSFWRVLLKLNDYSVWTLNQCSRLLKLNVSCIYHRCEFWKIVLPGTCWK